MTRRALLFAALLALPAPALLAQTADLRFNAASAGGIGFPGGYFAISIAFTNYGPSAATDFKLTIAIPGGATYDGTYAVSDDVKCDGPPTGSAGTFTCTSSSFAATPHLSIDGYSSYVNFLPLVDPATPPGTVLTFQVTMTASNALHPSQSATATVKIVAPADLTVSADAPSVVKAGDMLITNITLTNDGPGDAIGASILVPQPGAVVLRMTGPDGWDCSPVTACNSTGPFPPGRATFVVTSFVPLSWSGSVTQKLFASSSNDPHYLNNTVYATTAVDPTPNSHPTPPPNRRRAARH